MPNEAKKLGENLRRIRSKAGISQSDVAKSLGVSRGFVSDIENGKRNPTLATIARIAKAINVETEELFK